MATVAVDLDGNVVWSYNQTYNLPVKLLANGNMMTMVNGGIVREFDLAGNMVRELTLDDLNQHLADAGYTSYLTGFHHDLIQLPNGHFVLLCLHSKDFTDLPNYPGTTSVTGDALVDVDENFDPVWAWDTFDHLDINRHPWGFPDWTHSNTIVYLADDGNLLLSSRHQNWLVKIDYANGAGSGNVLWRLGAGGDFALQNGTEADWFYAQHYPFLTSPTTKPTILLVDNGDYRPDAANVPCATDCYTRAAIFEVNEAAKTASVVWSTPLSYSFWGGSAQLLSNGNVDFDLTAMFNPGSRVVELSRDPVPQTIWQLDIFGPSAYRATRIPSLYPGVAW